MRPLFLTTGDDPDIPPDPDDPPVPDDPPDVPPVPAPGVDCCCFAPAAEFVPVPVPVAVAVPVPVLVSATVNCVFTAMAIKSGRLKVFRPSPF